MYNQFAFCFKTDVLICVDCNKLSLRRSPQNEFSRRFPVPRIHARDRAHSYVYINSFLWVSTACCIHAVVVSGFCLRLFVLYILWTDSLSALFPDDTLSSQEQQQRQSGSGNSSINIRVCFRSIFISIYFKYIFVSTFYKYILYNE